MILISFLNLLLDTNNDHTDALSAIHPLLPYLSSFGLGVVTMAVFLLYVTRNYKYERVQNKELSSEFIELAKSTLVSLNDIRHIIDNLVPIIQQSGNELKGSVIAELRIMRENFDVEIELLKSLLNDLKKTKRPNN